MTPKFLDKNQAIQDFSWFFYNKKGPKLAEPEPLYGDIFLCLATDFLSQTR